MKLRATKKDIKKNCGYLYSIGYCELQTLLYYKSPFAYSCGQNGWACDYYDLNGICISTGYSPIGDNVDYKIIKDFEARAQKINHGAGTWEENKAKIEDLIKEFITTIKK